MRVGAESQTLGRILRKYYEPLYSNTFDNSEETDKFLKKHKLPRLTQKEMT